MSAPEKDREKTIRLLSAYASAHERALREQWLGQTAAGIAAGDPTRCPEEIAATAAAITNALLELHSEILQTTKGSDSAIAAN